MIAVGFAMYKAKRVTDTGVSQMTDLLLYAVTPCVVFNAFNRPFDPATARFIAVFAAVSAAFLTFSIGVGILLYRGGNPHSRAVLRFSTVFSNCGFMGTPLAGAVWMSGEKLSLKRGIVNPCVLGLLAGLPVFLLSLRVPSPVGNAVSMLAALNSPLAMIVIGTHLAKADLVSTLKDLRCYPASLLRLIVLPAVIMPAVVALPLPDNAQKVTLAVMFGAPVAASCALFATKFHRDSELASRLVATSTLFSMLTLPLLVSLVSAAC